MTELEQPLTESVKGGTTELMEFMRHRESKQLEEIQVELQTNKQLLTSSVSQHKEDIMVS